MKALKKKKNEDIGSTSPTSKETVVLEFII